MPDLELLVPGMRVSMGKCAQCSLGAGTASMCGDWCGIGRQEGSAAGRACSARPTWSGFAKHRCQSAGCSVVAGTVKADCKRIGVVHRSSASLSCRGAARQRRMLQPC